MASKSRYGREKNLVYVLLIASDGANNTRFYIYTYTSWIEPNERGDVMGWD
jgi:hypothetical protein